MIMRLRYTFMQMMTKSIFFGVCIASYIGMSPRLFAAETRSTEAASYVELGDKMAHEGDFDRAIKTYGVALQFGPDYAPAFFKRGLARQEAGDLSGAIADFSRTLEIIPSCAEAYANRAYIHVLLSQNGNAFSDWTSALQINPRLTTVFYNRGNFRL